MTVNQEPTQAQRWLAAFTHWTDGITLASIAVRVVRRVDADFPNEFFKLDSHGREIGWRRVFKDRSYCEAYHADMGRISYGTLTEGMLGQAANGRIITNLH